MTLFLFSLPGCQIINTEANESAAAKLTAAIDSLNENADALSIDSKEEYISLAEEIKKYVGRINSDTSEFDTQEKIDKITQQYNDYYTKIKKIAEENNIELKEDNQ